MLRISEARKARGFTQEQLALEVGTTQQTIQRWESGQTDPKASDVARISNALGITVSFIMGVDNEKENAPLTDDERELIELFRTLPPKGRHAVLVGLRDFAQKK